MQQWSQKLATDIEVVDLQHKQIFQLMGAFATCCQHRGPSEHLVRLALRGLIDYSRTHFEDEAIMMQNAGVDPRHIGKHQMEHRSFLYDIDQFEAQMDVVTSESVVQVAQKLVRFMSTWLIRHIMGTDQAMAAQIAAIKRGISAEAAFLQHNGTNRDAHALRMSHSPSEMVNDPHAQSRRLAEKLDALAASSEMGGAKNRRAA